jgi:hypothetical protein
MDKDQFLKILKEQYLAQGVILTTKTSKPGRVVLKCDRGGIYAPAKPSSTNSTSRLTGCTLEVICSNDKGLWGVRKVIGEHNHPVGGDMSGHSMIRRPNDAEREHIRDLGMTGMPVKHILSSIRQKFPENNSSRNE